MQIPVNIITTSTVKSDDNDFDKLILKLKIPTIFDLTTSMDWSIFFRTVCDGNLKKIIIDMSDLNQIESSGIGVLINSAKLIRANQGDIVFINVPEEIAEIFRLVHLQRFIKFFATEQEAMHFFRVFM